MARRLRLAGLAAAVALCAIGAVGSFAATVFDGPVRLVSADLEPILRVASGAACVGLAAVAYVATRSIMNRSRASSVVNALVLVRNSPVLPTTADIDARLTRFNARYLDEVGGLFAQMLTGGAYWLRLEELVTIGNGRARSRSRAQYQFDLREKEAIGVAAARAAAKDRTGRVTTPHRVRLLDVLHAWTTSAGSPVREPPRAGVGSAQPRMIIPLMVLRKGELLDELDVTDSAGNRLTVLQFDDRLAGISITLVGLFCVTFFPDSSARMDFVDELDRDRGHGEDARRDRSPHLRCFRELERQISVIQRVDRSSAEKYFDDAVADLIGSGPTPRRLVKLKEFCTTFAEHYVLAVDAPAPDGSSLSIEYWRSRGLDPGETPPRLERVRRFFGLDPNGLRLPVSATGMFANYHIEIDAVSGRQYIAKQDVLLTDGRAVEEITKDIGNVPEGRVKVTLRNDSDAHPHLYLVGSGQQMTPGNLKWFVQLEEIPPGALGPVFAMAASATLIFGAFAFVVAAQLNKSPLDQVNADTAALVVAIPLFTLTVFGYSFERMLRSSLAAVLGFVGTGTLVVASAISLLTADNDLVTREVTMFGRPFYLPIMVCTLASLTITAFLMIIWTLRLRRYVDRRRGERTFLVPTEVPDGRRPGSIRDHEPAGNG